MVLSAVTESHWLGGKATVCRTGMEGPWEVTFELSPPHGSRSARHRSYWIAFYMMTRAKPGAQKSLSCSRSREKASVVGWQVKKGKCLQWSQEVDKDQMPQDLVDHSMTSAFYSKCRGKTLEEFKQGSIIFFGLYKPTMWVYRWLSSPLCYVAKRSNWKVINCLRAVQPKWKLES